MILTDMEQAYDLAIQSEFPDTAHRICWFHIQQALRKWYRLLASHMIHFALNTYARTHTDTHAGTHRHTRTRIHIHTTDCIRFASCK